MSASGGDRYDGKDDFTAPLGGAASGRLVFTSGASGIAIQADPALRALASGHFSGAAPGFQIKDDLVVVQTRRFPPLDWFSGAHGSTGEIRLNPTIPWEIEFRGGAARITANLRGIQLRSFDVLGGASQILLALSKPAETTYIYIAGGANQVTILRPAGVGVRVQVQGGASQLAFDEQRFGAVSGEPPLESPDYKSSGSRCDLCIAGGASKLTIGHEGQ